MAILGPALGKARRQAQTVKGMNNQRQVAAALNLFAPDNDDFYPESVATVGFGNHWHWHDPTRLAGNIARAPELHRSAAEYLRSYIPDADILHCPGAPKLYKYLQQAWDAGDDWDNPETLFSSDPVGGTYCLFWNYKGSLTERNAVFAGPTGPAAGRARSRLLIADYFGYDRDRSPAAYGCSQRLPGANLVPETLLSSAYWSVVADPNKPAPDVKLHAAYTDGHVEGYQSSETIPMDVSKSPDGTVPYDIPGPGIYYLPPAALW